MNGPPANPVPVVCALLRDGAGRVLVAQRPPHKHLGGRWEFPGGKIEPGESSATALQRELLEELGTTVCVGAGLPPYDFVYPAVTIRLHAHWCELAAGAPAPEAREHTALRWVAPAGLEAAELCPADVPLVAVLRAWAGLNPTPTEPAPRPRLAG